MQILLLGDCFSSMSVTESFNRRKDRYRNAPWSRGWGGERQLKFPISLTPQTLQHYLLSVEWLVAGPSIHSGLP